MNNEELFNEIKKISSRVEELSLIVQNPYLPKDVDPKRFHQDVQQCINEIRNWESSVTEHYRNMTEEQKNEIRMTHTIMK